MFNKTALSEEQFEAVDSENIGKTFKFNNNKKFE